VKEIKSLRAKRALKLDVYNICSPTTHGKKEKKNRMYPHHQREILFFFCLFGFLFFFRFKNKKKKKKIENQTNEIGRGIVTLTHDEPTQQPKNRKKGEFLLSSHTHAY